MKKRILIVEDDNDGREALQLLLELDGYETICAGNGMEALAMLAESPDLIITDIMMPEMDGSQFVSELRAQPKYANLPVICVSAFSNPAVKADVVMTKPVDADDLFRSIEQCLKLDNLE